MTDSDIDSFESNKKRIGTKRSMTLEDLKASKQEQLADVESERNNLKKDMLIQCKLNEHWYTNAIDKKKRTKQIEAQLLGMNQEFKLMERQIEKKHQKIKELRKKTELAQEFNQVRRFRKEAKDKFKEDQKIANKEQVKKGIRLRTLSMANKAKLLKTLTDQKHQMYKEIKQKAKMDRERQLTDAGSVTNANFLKARDNKIAEEKGNIHKKLHVKEKINFLSSRITDYLQHQNQTLTSLKHKVSDLVKNQELMRKSLDETNKELQREKEHARKLRVYNEFQDKIFHQPTFMYDFARFKDIKQKTNFLFMEEKLKDKEFKLNEKVMKTQLEKSLKNLESVNSVRNPLFV